MSPFNFSNNAEHLASTQLSMLAQYFENCTDNDSKLAHLDEIKGILKIETVFSVVIDVAVSGIEI